MSARHANALLRRGGVEYGLGHFPVMIALHVALLAGCVLEPLLGAPAVHPRARLAHARGRRAANGLRWWCIATLGERWTARVIVCPARRSCGRGPYRWFAPPELRRGRRRGRRAAADWLRVDHRVRVHGAQRRAADRPHPLRDRAPWRRRPRGVSPAAHDRRAGRRRRPGGPRRGDPLRARRACRSRSSSRARARSTRRAARASCPRAVRRLAALGVTPDGHPLRGIRYLDAAHQADAPFLRGDGLGVRRTVLHAALAARAAALGVPVIPARVTAFERHAGHVARRGRRGALPGGAPTGCTRRSAAYWTGRHRAAARLAAALPATGCAGTTACAPWTDLVEVHWRRGPRRT